MSIIEEIKNNRALKGKQMAFRPTQFIIDEVKKMAADNGVSESYIIRIAVEDFIRRNNA